MKNAIKVLCFVLVFIIAVTAGGYLYITVGKGDFLYIDGPEKGTVVITKYNGDDINVVVPDRIRFKKVVSIDDSAFKESKIESLEVSGNVTSIGKNAFQNCTALKSVKLKEGVLSIGESAFFGCEALTEISVPSTLKKLGDVPFINTGLESIDFGKNENFTFENGVIYSKDKTVVYEALTKADLSSYVCPDTVTSICTGAFQGHSEMKTFKINEGVKTLGTAVFMGCKGLSELRLPGTLISVGPFVASDTNIKKVYITKSTVTIDKNAFYKMEDKLTIVTVKGSKAEAFAKENGFKLELVDKI